jgi:hypothetical protein
MSRLTVAPVVLAAAIGAAMFIKEQEGILQARAFDYAQHDRHHRPRIAMALETIAGTPAAKNADMAGCTRSASTRASFCTPEASSCATRPGTSSIIASRKRSRLCKVSRC